MSDEREEFVSEHYAELVDALLSLGIEDADWHDGRGLADVLYCTGWRKIVSLPDDTITSLPDDTIPP